jgi:Bacteriophage Lambda NinG protein
MRIFGPHTSRPAIEHQKEVKKTDIAVSQMIRAQPGNCMTCGMEHEVYDCGHFMRREIMATRFHPWNIGKQGLKENRFEGGRTFEYGLAIDEKYGSGTAAFLHNLSKTIEPWSIAELQQLRHAARLGPRAYEQLYWELRPMHLKK